MTKAYMLDTDICSFIIKNASGSIKPQHSEQLDSCCISAATFGELAFWAMKKNSTRFSAQVESLTNVVRIIPLDEGVMRKYAAIRHALEKRGTPLPDMDMLIAATAMQAGATLVTHNIKHFSRIKGLKLEDWL